MSFRNSTNRRMMLRKMAKKIKFHIFRFHPTFSMLSREVVSVKKCKKYLCCNLFWVLQKYLYFDWASPVKLLEDPEQIATQIIFVFLVTLDLYIKHTKSRTKSEDTKFDLCQCIALTHVLPL